MREWQSPPARVLEGGQVLGLPQGAERWGPQLRLEVPQAARHVQGRLLTARAPAQRAPRPSVPRAVESAV